jgi:hypothetical protein
MRRALVVLLLLTGCGQVPATTPADGPTLTVRACRHRWSDLAQLHGENGNPEGSQQVLNARWDTLDHEAHRLSRTARGTDCGSRLRALRKEWGAVESLQYDLQPLDLPFQLTYAEGDRRHYEHLPTDDGSPREVPAEVADAFVVLRREAPLAAADLRAVTDRAGAVDPTDRAAVRRLRDELRDAAADSDHVEQAQAALATIQDAELDEE